MDDLEAIAVEWEKRAAKLAARRAAALEPAEPNPGCSSEHPCADCDPYAYRGCPNQKTRTAR